MKFFVCVNEFNSLSPGKLLRESPYSCNFLCKKLHTLCQLFQVNTQYSVPCGTLQLQTDGSNSDKSIRHNYETIINRYLRMYLIASV